MVEPIVIEAPAPAPAVAPAPSSFAGPVIAIHDTVAIGVAVTGVVLDGFSHSGFTGRRDLFFLNVAGVAAASYTIVSPLIHFARGKPTAAFISLGMRTVLAGGTMALVVSSKNGDHLGLVAGAGLLGFVVTTIDALVLCPEPSASPPSPAAPPPAAFRVVPSLAVGAGGAQAGLSGAF